MKKLRNMTKTFVLVFLICSFVVSSNCVVGRNSNIALRQQRNPNINCIPLKNCPEFLWLLQNKLDVPGMAFHEVLQYLQDQTCGFDGNDPKVKCNIVEDETVFEDPDSQIRLTQSAQHRSNIEYRHGGVIDVNKSNGPRS